MYNCVTQSQHYAGVAFDVGQVLSNSQRNRLRNTASSSRSLELCRTSNAYFQKDIIIEEMLTISCMYKIQKNNLLYGQAISK